jgi:hypothetical protein
MLKYIRDEKDQFYLFSNDIKHATVAETLKLAPKSAGFYMSDDANALAFGKSMTLNLGALPDDIVLIKKQMGE